MTCGCNAEPSAHPPLMYRGGRKRTRRIKRTYRKTKKTSSRRKRMGKTKQKLYGGNYLTGTIADGPEGTAFGKMTGAQKAGSHYEINSDAIVQPLGK